MPLPRDRLGELLTQHRQFLTQAKACISEDTAAVDDAQYKKFLSLLSGRIEAHQIRPQAAGKNDYDADNVVQWGTIKAIREPRDDTRLAFSIYGPVVGDKHTITVEDEEAAEQLEAQMQKYDKMSNALARASSQEQAIAELRMAGDGPEEQQPAVDTDQTRIALLKEYNDLRDVAQQFIGIIAENRSVPVRSLYADGGFGVMPED